MTVSLSDTDATRRWRQRARQSFVVVAALVVAGVVGAFTLPGGAVFASVTAGVMSLVAGFAASGAYCLGRVHALVGQTPAGTGQPQ